MLEHVEHIKIFDAKTHFSSLLVRVEAGEHFVITKHNHAIARLVPVKLEKPSVAEVIKNWRETRGLCRLDLPGGSAALKAEGRK